MSNNPIFSYSFTISENLIDENGHVNNVAYVQWMQEAAIRHSESINEYKPAENTTWYAREHRIEYLLPAFLGEEIEVRTWLSEIKRVRAHRRYEFICKADGKVIVKGKTDWVYVDYQKLAGLALSLRLFQSFSLFCQIRPRPTGYSIQVTDMYITIDR